MTLKTRAAVLNGVRGEFSVAEAEVPELAPGTMIVRQELCGICGTDVHVFQGHMPSVPMPVVLGHEVVGEIVALGEGVTEDATGRPSRSATASASSRGCRPPNDFFNLIAHQPTIAAARGAYGFAAASMAHLPLAVTGGYAQYLYLVPGHRCLPNGRRGCGRRERARTARGRRSRRQPPDLRHR